MATIRMAVVGLGEIARAQHLPAIGGDSRFSLVATVDPAAPAQPGVPHFASLEALLADGPKIDAVALCTPPAIRAQLAAVAIEGGLAVMLEKPPALGVSGAQAIAARAAAAGTTLFTAWHSREAAAVAPARAWLAKNGSGARAIRSASISWREDVRQWHPGQEWLLGAGGFGAFDAGINALSILTALAPGSLVVEACDMDVPANRQAPVVVRMAIRCGNGGGLAPVAVLFDILHPGAPEWTMTIGTDDGTLTLTHGGNRLTVDGAEIACGEEREYPRLYAAFADLVMRRASEVDFTPLVLIADACMIATRHEVAPFHF